MNDPTGKKCLQKLSKQTKAFDLAISLSTLTMAEKHRDLEGVNPTEFQALLVPVPFTYPSTEDLVDGCALFQCAFCYNFCSHFLHIQHKCIKRFLYVWLLFLFFFFGVLMFSEE